MFFHRYSFSYNFLVNIWPQLTSILIAITITVAIAVLNKICIIFHSTSTLFARLLNLVKWGLPLILLATSVDDIILYSSLQFHVVKTPDKSFLIAISYIACLLTIAIGLTLFIGVILLARKAQSSLPKTSQSRQRTLNFNAHFFNKWKDFQIVFQGFNNTSLLTKSCYAVYMLRLMLPMIIACSFYNSPFAQTILQLIVSTLILTYIVYLQPFEKEINHVQMIMIESVVLIMNVCSLMLVILERNSLGIDSWLVVIVGDIIVAENYLVNLLLLMFLGIKMIIEAKVIYVKLLDKDSRRDNAEYVGLLGLVLQQGGFGFEEMISMEDVTNNHEEEEEETKKLDKNEQSEVELTEAAHLKTENFETTSYKLGEEKLN